MGYRAFFALPMYNLLRHDSSLVSRRIGEPFALRADQECMRTLGIVQPNLNPMVVDLLFAFTVPEIQFGAVALKMLRADIMVKGSDNPALENREKSFDGVGCHVPAHVFTASVVHDFMALEHRRKNAVLPFAVSHKASLGGIQLSIQDRTQIVRANGRHMMRAHFAALAVHQAKKPFLCPGCR